MIEVSAPPLRDYQEQAHDAIMESLASVRSSIFVMPTGTGKTRVLAAVAESWRPSVRGRILAVAHREEIVQQLARAFESVGLRVEIEMGEDSANMAGMYGSIDVVCGSVQSMARRLRRYQPDDFALVIVDEAHHHVKDSQYSALVEFFAGAKVLGCTATPDRFDKRGLGGSYDAVAYTYEIREAIREKHLCQLRQKLIKVDGLDFSKIRKLAGDLNAQDLAKVMEEDGALHGIADPIVRFSESRPTLVFAVTVEHAHSLAAVINMYAGNGKALALDGGTAKDARRETLIDFRAGGFQYLVNCALYVEGTDLPFVSCIAVGRPTGSRALYQQMIGRGLRPKPDGGDCLVLDFAGNAGKHSLITAPQILGADVGPDVAALAAAKAAATGAGVQECLDLVEADMRLAELKRRAVQVRANVRVKDIDPFAVFGITRHDGRTTMRPSEKLAGALERLGVPEKEIASLDMMQARDLMDALVNGIKAGQGTFKMKRMLVSRALRSDLPFQEASAVIDAIARNGWRVPDDIIAKYGLVPEGPTTP